MDLKFLSMLVLVILICLYFSNEMKILKTQITDSIENTNKLIKNKFHSFSSELVTLNTDLINQTKKINKIHSQKITSMSNYFTESDNDGKNIMNYLSDAKETDKIFKIEFNENDKVNDDDIISNSSSIKDVEISSV